MTALLVAVLAASLQGAPGGGLGAMDGTWSTTVQPGPGEAPAISPSFTVRVTGDHATVTLAGEKEAHTVTVFEGEKGQPYLMFRAPHGRGGARLVIIRPIARNQVRFEVFVERLEGKPKNFYYAEVFRKDGQ